MNINGRNKFKVQEFNGILRIFEKNGDRKYIYILDRVGNNWKYLKIC